MGYNPHGRARIDPRHPSALGVCQRCGFTYQRSKLHNQTQWQGMQLQPLNIWVCDPCFDRPQEQLRAIILPPDPIPIALPFPEPYSSEVPSYMQTTDGFAFTTMDGTYNLITMMEVVPTPDPGDPYLGPPPFVPE